MDNNCSEIIKVSKKKKYIKAKLVKDTAYKLMFIEDTYNQTILALLEDTQELKEHSLLENKVGISNFKLTDLEDFFKRNVDSNIISSIFFGDI